MKKIYDIKQVFASLFLLFAALTSAGQVIVFSTSFNEESGWSLPGGGTYTGYNEKLYIEGAWRFQSTNSVRGDASESFGGSSYSFRDRGIFTVRNADAVNGISGFTFQLRDWMLSTGVDRNIVLSYDGGQSWNTIFTINKSWFNEYQVYQKFEYVFPGGIMDFEPEKLLIRIEGGDNTNNSRINIGQFTTFSGTVSANANLAVLTVGGINVLNLPGIAGQNLPFPGALLYIDDFTDFKGIEAETENPSATIEVFVNDVSIEETQLQEIALVNDDVVLVTVTAEDQTTKRYYKVLLKKENRTLSFTKPTGGEEYSTGDEVIIEWTSQNISELILRVFMFGLEQHVAEYTGINAATGQFEESLPNGAHGIHFFRLYDSSDEGFYAQSENVTFIDNRDPMLIMFMPGINSVEVPVAVKPVMTFDEMVSAGEGNLSLYKSEGNVLVESIVVSGSKVTFEDNLATINFSNPLKFETTYHILIDDGAIVDIAGNPHEGMQNPTDWYFTTISEEEFSLVCNGDFEVWNGGVPDCWYGSKSNIGAVNVVQYAANPQSGNYAAQLNNAGSTHQRFTSKVVSVEAGKSYIISFWVKGKGNIRTGIFDERATGSGYSSYNSYINVDSDTWTQYQQTVSAVNTSNMAEFIFSVVSTDESRQHLQIDNVIIKEGAIAPTVVSNIAELRAGTLGQTYVLTGQAVITFLQNYRNQKYIQDATAAIIIDDFAGVITTNYETGDGITGLTGTLGSYGGMLQLIPTKDPGNPTSNGNYIDPHYIALDAISSAHQARLLFINFVNFSTTGNFAVGTEYTITDLYDGSGVFRTNFFDADYIGTPIPQESIGLIALMTEFEGVFQLTPRSLDDFTGPIVNNVDEVSDLTRIYPNPFTEKLYLTNLKNAGEINVTNITGQTVLRIPSPETEFQINTSAWAPGLYFLKIYYHNGTRQLHKLIRK